MKNNAFNRGLNQRKQNYQQKKDERDFNYQQKKDERDFNYQQKKDAIKYAQDERDFNYQQKKDAIKYAQDERDFNYQQKKDALQFKREEEKEAYKHSQDAIKNKMEKDKFEKDLVKQNSEIKARVGVKLSDNDVKKCNELVPTTLSVIMTEKQGNNFGNTHNFVIGVKGLMHPVNSDEMISNLLDGFKSGNKFFKFLRWTTGEISFIKDLVLNINGIKEDALRKYRGGSHWWTTLKRRKKVAKLKNIRGKNQLLPNASIVCTMEEISELKEAYGLDLMNIKNIKKLMDTYFLLGFAIVDDAQELCYFIFDGESNYQAISYSGLEKENNSKNDFKEIYKLINSGRL